MMQLPVVLTCKECNYPVSFYSSATQCLHCGAWQQIKDSTTPNSTTIFRKKKKKGRGW